MDLICEDILLEILDAPRCCIFSPLCRFCRNSKIKCYVQDKLFVGWCNFYLKLVGDGIDTLTQLWDWTCFVALLNGLSQEKQLQSESVCDDGGAGFHHNWDIVQDYLVKEKVVKSVLINGKSLIIRKKFTHWLIEIIWNLIFRHHFNSTNTKMSRRTSIDYRKASNSLLKWIKRKIPAAKVTDIFIDLNDGVTLCQLVNSIAPNTIDNCLIHSNLDAESVAAYAIQAAKDVLGIPPLITAEDLFDDNVDEKVIITYLALYRSADRMLAKGIRPISPREIQNGYCSINNVTSQKAPKRFTNKNQLSNQNIAYGFGIRYGEVGKPTEFIVHLNGARSDLSVSIKCFPDSEISSYLPAEPKIKSVGECSYIVSYTPIRSGSYEISVLCGRKHILNSPFNVIIKDPILSFQCFDEQNHGLSIEPVNHYSDSDYLLLSEDDYSTSDNVINGNSSPTRIENHEKTNSAANHEGNYLNDSVFFEEPGRNQVNRNSDYSLSDNSINRSSCSSQGTAHCVATGSGLSTGEVRKMSHFEVRTTDKTNGPLSVFVTCPAMSIPTPHVNTRLEDDQLVHDVMFLPTEPGTYEIEIKWGKKLVPGSPYQAVVIETNALNGSGKQQSLAGVFSEEARVERTAVIFYSATSCDRNHQRRREYLESLLCGTLEKLHVENIPIDLDLTPGQRIQLFKITRSKQTPFAFFEKRYLGDYETLVSLHRRGELTEHIENVVGDMELLDYDISGFIDVHIIEDIRKTLRELNNPPVRSRLHLANSPQHE